jgi:hypothetical protein
MKDLNPLIQAQFDKMCATGKLFKSNVSGEDLWSTYLRSFEEDAVFRNPDSTTHTCSTCNNFIRRYGNIVALDTDNKIMTLFDVKVEGEYKSVMAAMSERVKLFTIGGVFFETIEMLRTLSYEPQKTNREVYRLGIAKNVHRYTQAEVDEYPGTVKLNEIYTFNHFHLDLPKAFVKSSYSYESINADYVSAKEVFKRGLDEIPLDTLELVRDLIIQGSLLNGDAHLSKVSTFIKFKKEYEKITAQKRENWCWKNSYNLPIAKFRNELIGTLCVELAEGVELNQACSTWNQRVDPVNYMKVKSPITQRQIEEAQKFITDNGYLNSFSRRLATIDDINVEEILHSNIGDGKIKDITIFDKLKPTVSTRHKRSEFDSVEEVPIEKFMKDILPTCTSVEAFLAPELKGQIVNLTVPINKESKPIFKWDNNFSYTFNGNLAGQSMIKEAVKSAGGIVDGVLNFRLAWNDNEKSPDDNSDLDAWAMEPNGDRIGYSTQFRRSRGYRSTCSGQLDVDNTCPSGVMAVENITWIDKSKMKNGTYTLTVHQFASRGSKGFKAEIEVEGVTYCYEYNTPVSGTVTVARIILNNGVFTVVSVLPEVGSTSADVYNLPTNQFHKVNLICLSPNHWGHNKVGNKHYLFMLDQCHTDEKIRTFHNENLLPELVEKHRKVMDVLGNTTMVAGNKNQLAGIGFNATIPNELVVKVSGSHKRMLKIKF